MNRAALTDAGMHRRPRPPMDFRRRRLAATTRRTWAAGSLFAIAALALCPAAARAQEATPRFASPFLPSDHWALGAVRRLEALGLAPAGFGWAETAHTQREVAALFEHAARAVDPDAAGVALLVERYRVRFAEEFPAAADAVFTGGRGEYGITGGRLTLGYDTHKGEVLAGVGYNGENDWTGVRPVSERSSSLIALDLYAALGNHLALGASPVHRAGRWGVDGAHLTGSWRALGVWAGRRPVGYRPGVGGGLVLSGDRVFDGAGLFLTDPVRLPGLLGVLGPIRAEVFGSRIENNDRIRWPWFAGMRGSLQPHPRLGLGLSRAGMFGGIGNTPVRFRDALYMLVGGHGGAGELEKQVVAVDVRYRPPVSAVPVALLLEWGFTDSAGAWFDNPAIRAGLELPALPSLPAVALGAEWTTFPPQCCGHSTWYRHWSFREGFTVGGRPLGHPLGGHGTEWLGYTRADLWDARLKLDLRAFLRDRGQYNILAPERAGRSWGGELSLEGQPSRGRALFVRGSLEDGRAGWREVALNAGARLVF